MKKIDTNSIDSKKTLPLILVHAVMIFLAVIANVISPGFLALGHIGSIFKTDGIFGNCMYRTDAGYSDRRY